jgi:hypothetical protein
MAKGAHGFNHVNAKMVLVKIPHTVREFGLTVCPFFGFLPLMVEGHVPQGVEVQVLSSAQKKNIPAWGMFFFCPSNGGVALCAHRVENLPV